MWELVGLSGWLADSLCAHRWNMGGYRGTISLWQSIPWCTSLTIVPLLIFWFLIQNIINTLHSDHIEQEGTTPSSPIPILKNHSDVCAHCCHLANGRCACFHCRRTLLSLSLHFSYNPYRCTYFSLLLLYLPPGVRPALRVHLTPSKSILHLTRLLGIPLAYQPDHPAGVYKAGISNCISDNMVCGMLYWSVD